MINGRMPWPVPSISAFFLPGRLGSRLAKYCSVVLPQIRPRPVKFPMDTRRTSRTEPAVRG